MRQALLKLHLWAGLSAAALLIVIGASGAAEVYELQIDRALNPATSYVTPGATTFSVADLLANVRAARPGDRPVGVHLAEEADLSVEIQTRSGLSVFMDPYTGRLLGVRNRQHSAARYLHRLHTELLAGPVGQKIVDWMDAFFLFLAATGLYLWWPRGIFSVRRGSSWKRANFDLHNAVGLYASIVFLAIAGAGVLIGFEDTIDPVVKRLNAWNPEPPPLGSTMVAGGGPVTVDRALEAARRALPGAFASNISIPLDQKAVFRVLMKFPEDRTPAGRSRVYVDQFSGRPLFVENTRTAPLGTRILNLKRSVHTGDVFGAPTRAIYCVTSLALVGQVVTGVLIWWNRRPPARSDRASRQPAA